MEFNKIPLTTFTPTLADIVGAKSPEKATDSPLSEFKKFISDSTGRTTVDKILIFNPDAIGQEFYEKYRESIFKSVDERTDFKINFLTAYPPKTPVCFATMYTGATPIVHGIEKYEKPTLKIDTLFDAWFRAGKKVAVCAKAKQSIPLLFAETHADIYLTSGDKQSVDKGIELIKNDSYDIIIVYNQEYDDMLHITHPESFFCKRAARNYVNNFNALSDAVSEFWSKYTVLTAFSPDHGAHRAHKILNGTHGNNIPSDMNITHLFKLFGGTHE